MRITPFVINAGSSFMYSISRLSMAYVKGTVLVFTPLPDMIMGKILWKDKNSLFKSGSSKKSSLIGLCDSWGYPIKIHIQNEDCHVNPAIG